MCTHNKINSYILWQTISYIHVTYTHIHKQCVDPILHTVYVCGVSYINYNLKVPYFIFRR